MRNGANGLAEFLREKLGWRICGPAIPEIGRIREQYRLIIMVKIESAVSVSKVKTFLKEAFCKLREEEKFRNIRIFCDVDP